ncbi:hypothetical protein [Thermocoleostomius sinensis]|uniref:Uncharacterized protein n=1 Tax=Thermocoleostomius sinensis A174 TaxID=2016057 RepID=A0A9E8ZFU4_9CYAN|nr:hypothetical protein [Thermocoleostomius sinensis]WAL61002.1 hypothetical protein OXH18_03100 [Thermocoleostomius sinensis A174]
MRSTEILAYAMLQQGSKRIQNSQVLLGLTLFLLEAALDRSHHALHSPIGAWFLQPF